MVTLAATKRGMMNATGSSCVRVGRGSAARTCARRLTWVGTGRGDDRAGGGVRLSQRRAEAVVAYLVRRGVAEHRLWAVGFGESRLLTEYAPPDDRQRRVEIVRSF